MGSRWHPSAGKDVVTSGMALCGDTGPLCVCVCVYVCVCVEGLVAPCCLCSRVGIFLALTGAVFFWVQENKLSSNDFSVCVCVCLCVCVCVCERERGQFDRESKLEKIVTSVQLALHYILVCVCVVLCVVS